MFSVLQNHPTDLILGPTQPSIELAAGRLPLGVKQRGAELTTNLHTDLRLRKHGVTRTLHHKPTRRGS